jgi:hypothetical protein
VLTRAILESLDVHVIARPVSTLPVESLLVAVSWTVAPARMLAVAGLTVTDATGTRATATLAVPLLPSLVAVIVAEPAVAPVTSPLALTSATVVSLDTQLTARPVSMPPAESVVVADNCMVAPTRTVSNKGVTETEATASSELSKRVGSSHAAKSANVARTTCGHLIRKRIP